MNINSLKTARNEKGFRQKELANKANIPVRTLQNYESNERVPSVHTAIRIADALKVNDYDDFKQLFTPQSY